MSLNDFKIKEKIIDSLKQQGFNEFTEIQKKVFAKALLGQNIVACSKTGSGKTHAFLVPIFNQIDYSFKKIQAVIMAPSKELSLQIFEFAKKIDSTLDIRCFTKGTDRLREINRLKSSQPQIVIGTPGRINDYLKLGFLNLNECKIIVVDEADMTFENGFMEDVYNIINAKKDAQIMAFSATIFEQIKAFMKKIAPNKNYVLIEADDFKALNIKHYFIKLKKNEDKWSTLLNFIKIVNPYLCLIFANTKKRVEEIYNFLNENNIKCLQIHGDLEARQRKKNILEAKKLKYQYIVCSDIAARGIDILDVSVVLNFELPSDIEFYLHRSGRTARNNKFGECYSFYDFDNKEYLAWLEKKGVTIEYKRIINDEIVDYNVIKNNKKRISNDCEFIAAKIVKKSNQVKPGYKKKYQNEVKKLAKSLDKRKKK